jgi:hypothetical protein
MVMYQVVFVLGIGLHILNIKNKIKNGKKKGQTLLKLSVDNKAINMISALIFGMLVLMGISMVESLRSENKIPTAEMMQYVSTIVLFSAVMLNTIGSTKITEGGILRSNTLIPWEDIKAIEWTGFNKKTCKLIVDYKIKESNRRIRLTVKDDKIEKEKVFALIKQYRKASKKKK